MGRISERSAPVPMKGLDNQSITAIAPSDLADILARSSSLGSCGIFSATNAGGLVDCGDGLAGP